MKWLISVLALLAGAASPVQAGLNAQLRERVGGPFEAATLSSTLTTILLGLLFVGMIAAGRSSLDPQELRAVPWHLWLGGALGAYIVAVALIGASTLDAALLIGLMVLGQMIASVVLDHFGWLSFEVQRVNAWRIGGVALILGGVAMILRN